MTAGPPASWISRGVPAVSGMALRPSRPAGTGQDRCRAASWVLIGGPQCPAPTVTAETVAGAAGATLVRWLRHSETPRPIRATPTGTAIGRSNDVGRNLS